MRQDPSAAGVPGNVNAFRLERDRRIAGCSLGRALVYLPREVFFTFAVFFAGFATGFRGVPAASALSFCFLVAIADHDFPSSRFQNGTAFVSLAGVAAGAGAWAAATSGSTLGVSVMITPSILRTKPRWTET